MYFEKVLKAFNEFDENVKGAEELFHKTVKQLQVDYGNGRFYEEKFKEAKDLYDNTFEAEKNKGLKIVADEFDKINEKVKNFVTSPTPDDFIPILEAVKIIGKNLTEIECDTYLDKYKNNYVAYRCLTQCIEENTGRKYNCVKYDSIKSELDEYSEMSKSFFREYRKNGIYVSLVMSEKYNPLTQMELKLNKFLNEDVGSYTEEE